MIELQYLRSDEVAGIPHRDAPMQVAPTRRSPQATFAPDVVIFRGNARQIMLVSEAARAAGHLRVGRGHGSSGLRDDSAGDRRRLPAVASVGCIGNRVYTGLGDDELYFAVPGKAAPQVLEQLDVIVEREHRSSKRSIASARWRCPEDLSSTARFASEKGKVLLVTAVTVGAVVTS